MGLTASNVSAGYRGRLVVQDVSCELEPGEVTALIGPNGAGKSTLVRVLVGALTPSRGKIDLDGVPLSQASARERASRLALIPQVSGEGRAFSAIQTVRLGRLAIHESAAQAEGIARAVLERVGLTDRAGDPLGTLSVGQQQRVLVARALAQLGLTDTNPRTDARPGRYLIADEPIAAMDPRHALQTMAILRDSARAGVGVLVVLHDFALAARFADRTILMDERGRAAASGPTDDVLTTANLESVFGTRFETMAGPTGKFVIAVGRGD